MSDDQLRQLERLWRQTSAPDDAQRLTAALRRTLPDEQALLARLVELGVTSQARLELAAFLGHAGAATLLEGRERTVFTTDQTAGVFGLSASGLRAWVAHGCPVAARRGRRMFFDLPAVTAWRETNTDWRASFIHDAVGVFTRGCAAWEPLAAVHVTLTFVRATELSRRTMAVIEQWLASPSDCEAAVNDALRAAELDGPPAQVLMDFLAAGGPRVDRLATAAKHYAWQAGLVNHMDREVTFDPARCREEVERLRAFVRRSITPWALFHELPVIASPPPSATGAVWRLRRLNEPDSR